jgi:alkylation response protein AidB-like acyl-CoA dehydrogenase
MSLASPTRTEPVDWPALMDEIGPRFAARVESHDATDTFVSENFAELKARNVLAVAVPAELGGGGASYGQLCDMLRILAHYCGSTALTLSMHTHLVATLGWRWRREPSLEAILRRIAAERLLLVGSGASDWLSPSGTAEHVNGGFRISAEKIFASGVPAGDLFMTQAVYEDAEAGPIVLHFAIPIQDAAVEIRDTWRALGMRGTGSHHVRFNDLIVPESAVSIRRPVGKWIPLFQLYACIIPLPLIYAVYLGIAEAARDTALAFARKRSAEDGLIYLVGEMENELATARMAHRDMAEAAEHCNDPGPETTNRVIIARTLVGRAVLRVVEKAMEVAGGSSLYRAASLERLFRDVQGARFHRPQEQMQLRLSGCLALGRSIDE